MRNEAVLVQPMEQIILVCGEWKFVRSRWYFVVEGKRGSRMIISGDCMRYENLIGMVCEDYGLDRREYDVKLSYMASKEILQNLPLDTPPVYISNCRQFEAFLGQSRGTVRRICVELMPKLCKKQRAEGEDRLGKMHMNEEDEVPLAEQKLEEDCDEVDESRFDYCDDSDGTDADDENFEAFGKVREEVKEEEDGEDLKLPPKKIGGPIFVSEGNATVSQLLNFDMNNLDLNVGQRYETKRHLVVRMKILSVVQKFDFEVYKSTPFLLIAKCWVKGCSWKVRATPAGDYPRFHVRQHVSEHTCSVTERSARSRQATHDILALLYQEFVGGVGPSVLPMHVREALNKRFQTKVSYWKAYRVLRHARELVSGTAESGYDSLPTYLYMVKRENPGSHTRLAVDENHRFKYLFLAFGASIEGFPFMRKVVVVDGTFLQGKYKGTLLTAASQDGNFQIFPIAFAVVDTENDESWKWFFEQLSGVILDHEDLAIISDRHSSIGKAIATVYPKCSRGICTYHLYKNILVRFKGREAFSLVKKAAYAFRQVDFQTTFDQLQALNPALHAYLERADVRQWARVHFRGDRYNILTSNIAESLNQVVSQSRKLPIVQLLEVIRSTMTRWFDTRRSDALKLQTTLTRGVEKVLESRVENAKLLRVQTIDAHRLQVTGGGGIVNVVNLTDRKCTCRRFDLERLPCVHAIAAGEHKQISRVSLCHMYYHASYLYNAYSAAIMPRDFGVPVPEHVATKVCLPPIPKQQPGRPKKSRMKSVLEIAMAKKRPRKLHACGNCKQGGHNRKTCKLD